MYGILYVDSILYDDCDIGGQLLSFMVKGNMVSLPYVYPYRRDHPFL